MASYEVFPGRKIKISHQQFKKLCYVDTASCIVSGDPRYKTFDGVHYGFQGACTYILADIRLPNDSNLRIVEENEFRNGNTRVSFIKSATITFVYNQFSVEIMLARFKSNQPSAKVRLQFLPSVCYIQILFGQL